MLGAFRQEQADFEQHPPELREEPARRPKAAVNKEAAGTALLLGAGLAGGNPRTRGGRGGWRGVRPPQSEVLPACVEGREAAPRGMLVINRKHSVSTTGGDGCAQPPERHGSTEKTASVQEEAAPKQAPWSPLRRVRKHHWKSGVQPPRHPAKANAPRRHSPHVRRGLGEEIRERKEEAACKTRLAQGKGARTVREQEGSGTIGYETCRRKDSATWQPIRARSALPRAAGEAGNSSGCASNFQLPKPEAQHLPLELRGSSLAKTWGNLHRDEPDRDDPPPSSPARCAPTCACPATAGGSPGCL